jgi:potassium efflux system protein
VWSGVLPALRYLDTQPLWSVSRQVTEVAAAGATPQTIDKLVPITVADLMLVVLVAIVAVVALRNIPGLLDITLFQKFSVQAGERYAFNTLIRYVIIIVGLIYMFYKVGLQWKQIQWLAAGVSVGLGFGLQEIFANFVSGLILLFERPVRVGDIVTVGDVSGRVTQIRIRATTIVNWDHKEHLIPNKELVTKQVLNWTLNDRIVRLLILVNVAYGSDYDKAREILLKIGKENPFTLDDPAPSAAIEKFGQGNVEFSLSVHLPNLDNMTDVRHEMITKIDKEFRAAGISIPVPQIDVHVERDTAGHH